MTPDDIINAALSLSTKDLGYVIRFIEAEYSARLRFTPGLTEEEQRLLATSKLDAIKEVRNRTGLGLVDAKKLVEMWQAGQRSDHSPE